MKESEAVKKLCPIFGSAALIASAGLPRNETGSRTATKMAPLVHCRGSACMLWDDGCGLVRKPEIL